MNNRHAIRGWRARAAAGGVVLCLLGAPASAHDTGAVPDRGATPEMRFQVPVVAQPDPARPGATFAAPPWEVGAPSKQSPTLARIRSHMKAGDAERALATARAFVEVHPHGRERDAAWMLIGMVERERGRHNAASDAFARVRAAEGPLAAWAAFHEAEQDLARGKPWVAIKECETYLERWPDGAHADDCRRVSARAWATVGRAHAALTAADAYDADHPGAPIREQIEIQLAEWEARNEPEAAVRRLRKLTVTHAAPLTGRYAEELLEQLALQGVEGAAVPDDTHALKARAISLRDAGRSDAAWAVWEELTRRASDDPALQRWLDAQAAVFAYRTRRYDFLVDHYRAEYERSPTGEKAWDIYRILTRAGRYDEAAEVAHAAQARHGGTSRWSHSQTDVGYAMMLGGRYDDAIAQFERVQARGGWVGRKAAWEAAFATLMSGDDEAAVARFDAVLASRSSYHTEARYWRAQALERLGRADEAAVDRWWVLDHDPESWYAVLVRQSLDAPAPRPFARDGRWPGPALPDLVVPIREPAATEPLPVARRTHTQPLAPSAAFGTLTWPMRVGVQVDGPRPPPLVLQDLWSPPDSYRPGAFFSPKDAADDLARLAEQWGEAWPVLPAIRDLAAVGLYDLTGPMFASFYEEYQRAARYRSHPNHLVTRQMNLRPEQWRPLFLAVRDHHHAARFTHGLHEHVQDDAARRHARQLAWPLAHDRYVWSHAREQDVDPYLVLGLMRQESVYASTATSRVGASGAMQIMPRTGHLLADLAHDTHFTAGDLEDPVLAIGYGLTYLGLLMQRFDGVYPLAVASYNGGPHNVSSWLKGTGLGMAMDAWVEHVPFMETRTYVKKVSSNYASYLALYAPEGTTVRVPPRPAGDDPSIVDF